MKAIMLAIGNEVVNGDIVNTNAAYISDYLKKFGIETICHIAVTDKKKHIIKSIEKSLKKADLIMITGGLGPTFDDITKKSVADALGLKLIKDIKSEEKIKDYFVRLGKPMSELNRVQCYFPMGAVIIPNNNGTAPGAIIKTGEKAVMMFPGPPSELKPMLESDEVIKQLNSMRKGYIKEKVLKFFGIGESSLCEILSEELVSSKDLTAATYIETGEVKVKITARAEGMDEASRMAEELAEKIKEKAGEYIYSEENENLQEAIVRKLTDKNLSLITVESCTGGLIGKKITEVSGSSAVYKGGLITYSNEMKKMLCGVKDESLDAFGAVSKAVCEEMAEGARLRYNADISVSVTGVAGPGCSEDKPAGLVYIGVSTKDKTEGVRFNFNGNREKVREQSAKNALYAVLKIINK